MKYTGSKEDIGISKVQGLIDLKADLRGWRLKGENTLKPIDPLFSEGISAPAHQESASFQGQNEVHPRDEAFEGETYRYVKESSKIPSWISRTKTNPELDKSLARTQRNTDQVQVMSDWTGEEPQKAYLSDNTPQYEFATDFKREAQASIKVRNVGSRVPTVSGFTVETSLPRDKVATLFYQKTLQQHGHPGGQESKDLKYNKALEETLGLIPFCITTITPDHRTYLNFQANLDSYNDNYSGEWDSIQYVGRAEKFWGYTGFSRTIDLSFKVAIFRKEDCEEMYHRLNRLVGATAPSYGEEGLFMRGTLASLTVGDLLKHKAGIINSVKISWQQDYPWEVKEFEGSGIPAGPFIVPHVLDVSLQFTPIEEKTVTEDNGDYFVFRTEMPESPRKTAEPVAVAKPEPDPEPETRLTITKPVIEEIRPQIDHTAVATRGNVEGGGGGTGASLPNPLNTKTTTTQSGIISRAEQRRKRKAAIRNSRNNQLSEESKASLNAFIEELNTLRSGGQ